MSQSDKDMRVTFARRMQADYPMNVWTDSIAFYLDGISFVYKTNPMDQACVPKGRVWRKKSEGLTQGCLAKGRKVGTGGKVAKFMVAISHGKGVLVCDRYEKWTQTISHLLLTRISTPCSCNPAKDRVGSSCRTVIPLKTAKRHARLWVVVIWYF